MLCLKYESLSLMGRQASNSSKLYVVVCMSPMRLFVIYLYIRSYVYVLSIRKNNVATRNYKTYVSLILMKCEYYVTCST